MDEQVLSGLKIHSGCELIQSYRRDKGRSDGNLDADEIDSGELKRIHVRVWSDRVCHDYLLGRSRRVRFIAKGD